MINEQDFECATPYEIAGAIETRRARMEELIGEIEFLQQLTGGDASGGRQGAAACEMLPHLPPCGAGDEDEKTLEELCRTAEEVLSRLTYRIKELQRLKCEHHFLPDLGYKCCTKCGAIEVYNHQ